MQITVETGKWAERFVSEPIVTIMMPEKSAIADVIQTLAIPTDEAGVAVINGSAVKRDHVLSNGDTVKIHPVVVGG
jgi:sulfur carrier protein ThiS